MTTQSIEERISGTVVHRGDPDYERARHAPGWNEIKPERYPDLIVQVASEDDVIEAVNYRSSMVNQTLPGRGSGASAQEIYCNCKQDFQKGKGDPVWHQRLNLGQPYPVPYKTAEQESYGMCPHNKLGGESEYLARGKLAG